MYELICSERILDRRIALVATWPMIRSGATGDTLKLVEQVLDDEEDLIHKGRLDAAGGWEKGFSSTQALPEKAPLKDAQDNAALLHREVSARRAPQLFEWAILE
jgi:hypothetical protein